MQSQIQCPCCATAVILDTQLLLIGHQFTCKGCGSGIGLAGESKSAVESAVAGFNEIKARSAEVGKAAQNAVGRG